MIFYKNEKTQKFAGGGSTKPMTFEEYYKSSSTYFTDYNAPPEIVIANKRKKLAELQKHGHFLNTDPTTLQEKSKDRADRADIDIQDFYPGLPNRNWAARDFSFAPIADFNPANAWPKPEAGNIDPISNSATTSIEQKDNTPDLIKVDEVKPANKSAEGAKKKTVDGVEKKTVDTAKLNTKGVSSDVAAKIAQSDYDDKLKNEMLNVARYQTRAAAKGMYRGKIDGMWGKETQNAYEAIEKQKKGKSAKAALTDIGQEAEPVKQPRDPNTDPTGAGREYTYTDKLGDHYEGPAFHKGGILYNK